MLNFAFRNLLLFFRDRTAVVLSFLAEFIMIGLYILFIRDNLLNSFHQIPDADLLIDIWMIAGILGTTSVSTTMSVYGIMIEDKNRKIYRDFMVSPLGTPALLGGYLTSAFSIGLIMTFLVFLLSEIYLHITYGVYPGADRILWIYTLFIITSFSSASITLLLVSYLKSSNALAACSTILGALIGFLTGIYLPMGSLPNGVQILVKSFPVSHSVLLFRQALMEPFIANSFQNTNRTAAQEFTKYMGIQFSFNDTSVPLSASVFLLVIVIGICLTISMWRLSRNR